MQTTTRPLRLVLDTNVWLDWLAFDDAIIGPLKNAQVDGAVKSFPMKPARVNSLRC